LFNPILYIAVFISHSDTKSDQNYAGILSCLGVLRPYTDREAFL
jgi:hypothetical protein